jgi:hypothetical protein
MDTPRSKVLTMGVSKMVWCMARDRWLMVKPVVMTLSKTPALVTAILVADLYSARWMLKSQHETTKPL